MGYSEAEHAEKEKRGLALRKQLLGTDWIRDTTNTTPGLQDFTDAAVEAIWVQTWSKEEIDTRIKEAATIGAMVALGAHDELEAHVRGAFTSKLFTKKEIRAIALHVTPYVGFPAGRHSILVIDEVLGDDQELDS